MTRVILPPIRLFDQMERFWSLSKFWKELLYLNKSLDYLFKIESGVTIILIKISLVQLLFLVVHLGLVPSSTPFSFKINGSYVISSMVLFYFKGQLEFSKVIWQDIKLRAQGTSYGLLRKFQKAQDQPVQSKSNPSTPLITRKVRIKNRILTRKSICWIKSAKNCNPVIGDILVRSVGQLYICTFNSMPKSINPPKSYSNIFLVI